MNTNPRTPRTGLRKLARIYTTVGMSVVLAAGLTFGVAAPSAIAAPAGEVIALDQSSINQSTTPKSTVVAAASRPVVKPAITATPSAARQITIKTKPNSLVTVAAKGTKSRLYRASGTGTVIAKNLVAGKKYTVTSGKNKVSVVPEVKVAPAGGLRVTTTGTTGEVELSWTHATTRAQGKVEFTAQAIPMSANSSTTPSTRQKDLAISVDTTAKSVVITGLDPAARYAFDVTPHNALGKGKATSAIMARSLNDIVGPSGSVTPGPVATPEVGPTLTPKPAVIPTPAPAPAPAPAPNPGPGTKTIYVCPEGFTDAGSLCEKVTPYTYTTIEYSYHNESRVESCAGEDCPGSVYRSYPVSPEAPHCPQGGTIHGNECAGWTTGQRTVSYEVKNPTPAGFTDTGTLWSRKDAMPAGYTDNGSAWVKTAAKEAKVVPA